MTDKNPNDSGYGLSGRTCPQCGTWVESGLVHYCYNNAGKFYYEDDKIKIVNRLDEIVQLLKEIKDHLRHLRTRR